MDSNRNKAWLKRKIIFMLDQCTVQQLEALFQFMVQFLYDKK